MTNKKRYGGLIIEIQELEFLKKVYEQYFLQAGNEMKEFSKLYKLREGSLAGGYSGVCLLEIIFLHDFKLA